MADEIDCDTLRASLKLSDGRLDYDKLLEFLRDDDGKIHLERLYAVIACFFDHRFIAEVNQYRQRIAIFKREERAEEQSIIEEYIRVKAENQITELKVFDRITALDGKKDISGIQPYLDNASEILGKGQNNGRTMVEARIRSASWPTVIRNLSVLLQVCLPRKSQGDYQTWDVRNGEGNVQLRAGSKPDEHGRLMPGTLPWGKFPRIVLFYINTQVNAKPGSQTVYLGSSLANFLDKMGLSRQGYSYDKLHEELDPLLRCGMTISYSYGETGFPDAEMYPFSKEGSRTIYKNVSEQVDEFRGSTNQKAVRITLSDAMYQSMLENPLHISMESLKSLGKSNFALDIFAMLAEVLPRIEEGDQVEVEREYLEELFGVVRADKKKFYNDTFLPALDLVIEKAYPGANIRKEKNMLTLLPSPPASPPSLN